MHKITIAICLAVGIYSCSNDFKDNAKPVASEVEPTTPDQKNPTEANISAFIPEGYLVLDSTSGYLNGDDYKDIVLVLNEPDEEETSDVIDHPTKRPLLILTGQQGGTYQLAARGDNAVYCIDCGGMMGDPFQGLKIENDTLTVYHYGGSGWRWTRDLYFKYSTESKAYILVGTEASSYHAANPEEIEMFVETYEDFGKIQLEEFDIYSDED